MYDPSVAVVIGRLCVRISAAGVSFDWGDVSALNHCLLEDAVAAGLTVPDDPTGFANARLLIDRLAANGWQWELTTDGQSRLVPIEQADTPFVVEGDR